LAGIGLWLEIYIAEKNDFIRPKKAIQNRKFYAKTKPKSSKKTIQATILWLPSRLNLLACRGLICIKIIQKNASNPSGNFFEYFEIFILESPKSGEYLEKNDICCFQGSSR
jgi:hypothetical protein